MGSSPWLLVWSVALVVGCSEAQDDDDSAGPGPVTFDVAFDLQVVPAENPPTVATLEWTVDVGGIDDAWVEFGPDTTYGMTAPATQDEDGRFEALVLGMKAETGYNLRAVVRQGDQTAFSDAQVLTTGSLPPLMSQTELSVVDPEQATGGFLIGSLLAVPSMVVILDADGDYVWWYEPDVPHQISRAWLTRDGRSMIFLHYIPADDGALDHYLFTVPLAGGEMERISVPLAHHDFVELPGGTLTSLVRDERLVDDEVVVGDGLFEIAPDGAAEMVWSVWDHIEYDPEDVPEAGTEWTHVNAVDYDPGEDAYYVSIRNFDTIWKIDRASGDPVWKLGGEDSDFTFGPDDTLFQRQHQFQLLDDGIIVFDNTTTIDDGSRVVQYALDEGAGEASQVWEYSLDPPVYCYTFGDVTRLDSGNTLVTWSTAGQIEEVTPDQEVVWRVNTALGGGFSYMNWRESLYPE